MSIFRKSLQHHGFKESKVDFSSEEKTSLNMSKILNTNFFQAKATTTLLSIIANSDLRERLEFDCNQEASLVRGARPLNTSIQVVFRDDCY